MSFWRFTEQTSDPPAPAPEGAKVTGRLYTKLVSGILKPFIRDSNGVVSDFIGPEGPQGDVGPVGPPGPPGTVTVQDVVDRTDPIEIEALTLLGTGRSIFAREVAASGIADFFTNYIYDSNGPTRNPPYVMNTGDGGTTRWIASTSLFTQYTPMASDGSRFITLAEQTKLAGVATGATNTPLSATPPVDVTKAAASAGASSEAARQDHKHDISTAAAVELTDSTNAEGAATSLARSNHTHAHGNRGGGSLHANATTSVAGFMSAADKVKLDVLPSSVPDFWDSNIELHDDFPPVSTSTGQVGSLGWISSSTGTAATVIRKTAELGRPGIITLRCGSVAGGRAGIALGADGTNFCLVNGGELTATWIVRSAQVLSTFEMMILGLGDVVDAVGDQNNGVYFQLLGSPSPDTNWHIVTASGGTRSRVNTGIPYAVSTWFKLKLTVNAAGTSVQANINGVDVGTPITTNIPSVAISPIAKVDGIAGGTSSDTDIDFFKFLKTLSSAR